MALDFPNSPPPEVGQIYVGDNGITYTWDGVKWNGEAVTGGGTLVTSSLNSGSYVVNLDTTGNLNIPAAGDVVRSGVGIFDAVAALQAASSGADIAAANLAIAELQTNAAVQATAINTINNNVAGANAAVAALSANIGNLVNNAPAALDTLYEIANSLGNNASLSTTLMTAIAGVRANVNAANLEIASTNANLASFETYANLTFTGGGGTTYSNANVTAYLPTYSGNISNISFADGNLNLGGVQTPFNQSGTLLNVKGIVGMTASSGANISGFSIISAGTMRAGLYQYSNGVSILDGIGGTYSNANVSAYLPTYTGNLTAGNATIGTYAPGNYGLHTTGSSLAVGMFNTSALTVDSVGNLLLGGTGHVRVTGAAGSTVTIGGGSSGNVNVPGGIVFNDGTKQTTAYTGYGNASVAAYLTGAVTTGNLTTGNLTVETNAVVLGNLRVAGTQTTVNATTLSVDDLYITVANGAVQASDANGAGLRVAGALANIAYSSVSDSFEFNKPINANLTTANIVFSDSTIQSTAWTGTVANLTFGGNAVSLGAEGNLTLPSNMIFTSSPPVSGTGIIFGDGTYQYTAAGLPDRIVNGPYTVYLEGADLVIQNAIKTPPGEYYVATSDTSTEMSWSNSVQAPSTTVYSGVGTGPDGVYISNANTDPTSNYVFKNWTFGMDGNLTVPGDILPTGDNTQDLGSATMRFRHLYVGPGTVYVGNAAISSTTTGNLILPGVTRVVASSAYAEEVEDTDDQTHSFTTVPTVIDAAYFSFLDGNQFGLSFTAAEYSVDQLDDDGYIDGITIDSPGSGYAYDVANLAGESMWATEAATPFASFNASDWIQIPFRVRTRAGESEYDFNTGSADTGNITFDDNEIGSSGDFVNIVGDEFAQLQSGNNYIWVDNTEGSEGAYIQVGNRTFAFENDSGAAKIRLPAGADIVDNNGTSVLGGGGANLGNLTVSDSNLVSERTGNFVNMGVDGGYRMRLGTYDSDKLQLITDYSGDRNIWEFGANGTLVFPNGNATISNNDEFRVWSTNGVSMYNNGTDGFGAFDGYVAVYADNTQIGEFNIDGFEVTNGNLIIPNNKGIFFANGMAYAVGNVVAGGTASVTTDNETPATPSQGDLWYNTGDGRMYVRWDDTWIDTNPTTLVSKEYYTGRFEFSYDADSEDDYMTVYDNDMTIRTVRGENSTVDCDVSIEGADDVFISAQGDSVGISANSEVTISTNSSVNSPQWTFDATGNLVLPFDGGYILNNDNTIYGGGAGAVDLSNYQGNIVVNQENSGFVVDAAGDRRVGFMKYFGFEGSFVHANTVPFRVGRVSTTDITRGNADVYTTEVYIGRNGRVRIGDDDSNTINDPTHQVEIVGNLLVSSDINVEGNIIGIGTDVTITADTTDWVFGSNGTIILPPNGTIRPYGTTDDNQVLKLTPTGGEVGNHLHLTSGNMGVTSIFLGTDQQYVRTRDDGAMVIGTGDYEPDTPGYGNRWTFSNIGETTFPENGNVTISGNLTVGTIAGNGSGLTGVATKVSGSWTLAAGANTVNFTVPGPGTYALWVNGNIPNGICTYTATVVVTNNNVPVVGSQYAWYYAAGNMLVITSIPAHIVGTAGSIITTSPSTTTANVFEFGITNNSGSSQVVNYGYTKL